MRRACENACATKDIVLSFFVLGVTGRLYAWGSRVAVIRERGVEKVRRSELSEARDPSTDPGRLAELAAREDENERRLLRSSVGENPSAPAEVLSSLSDDLDSWVRKSVARNPSTPVDLLTRLADDPDKLMRQGVAGNPSTPVEVLARLADDRESDIRKRVAGNPSMTAERSEEVERQQVSGLQELIPEPGEWVFYQHVEEIEEDRGGFEAAR